MGLNPSSDTVKQISERGGSVIRKCGHWSITRGFASRDSWLEIHDAKAFPFRVLGRNFSPRCHLFPSPRAICFFVPNATFEYYFQCSVSIECTVSLSGFQCDFFLHAVLSIRITVDHDGQAQTILCCRCSASITNVYSSRRYIGCVYDDAFHSCPQFEQPKNFATQACKHRSKS